MNDKRIYCIPSIQMSLIATNDTLLSSFALADSLNSDEYDAEVEIGGGK